MKNDFWYGWFIEQSLEDLSIFKQLETVKMKSEEESWREHVVAIPENKILEVVEWLKAHLKTAWYAHMVKGDSLVVVYRGKTFRVEKGESFDPVREYGKRLGIIEDQLPSVKLFQLARESGY